MAGDRQRGDRGSTIQGIEAPARRSLPSLCRARARLRSTCIFAPSSQAKDDITQQGQATQNIPMPKNLGWS